MEEIIWNNDDFDFYQSLSNKDKLIYITDIYSGFFNNLGDDEDIEYNDFNSLEEDELSDLLPDKMLKIISPINGDIEPILMKLLFDGFILKKYDLVKVDQMHVHRYEVIGKITPSSLN